MGWHRGCSLLGGGPTGVSSQLVHPEGSRPSSTARARTTFWSSHPGAQARWLPVSGHALAQVRWPCVMLAPEGHTPASCVEAGDVLQVGRPRHASPWKAGSCAKGRRGNAREGRPWVCMEGAGGPGNRQPARNRIECGDRLSQSVQARPRPSDTCVSLSRAPVLLRWTPGPQC